MRGWVQSTLRTLPLFHLPGSLASTFRSIKYAMVAAIGPVTSGQWCLAALNLFQVVFQAKSKWAFPPPIHARKTLATTLKCCLWIVRFGSWHFLAPMSKMVSKLPSCGNWNVQRSLNAANLHLQLRDFRCCEDARLWNIDFYVDPTNPSLMIDGSGREIRYLGRLVIMVCGPDVSRRMLALSEDDEEWMLL